MGEMASIGPTANYRERVPHQIVLLGVLALAVAGIFYAIAFLYGSEGHVAPPGLAALSDLPRLDMSGQAKWPNRLYPLLLALAHHLGATGPALLEVAFALNALLFVLFAVNMYLAAKQLAPAAASGIVLLVLLNGKIASSVMELGDTGLFTTLLAAFVATTLYERHRSPVGAALLLGFAGWTRPEGLLAAIAIFVAGLVLRARRVFGSSRWIATGIFGFLLGATLLTQGWTSPETIAAALPPIRETHFAFFSFTGALAETSRRFALAVRDVLFNMPSTEGAWFFIPFLGGAFAFVGLCALEWQTDIPRALLSALALTLVTALLIGASQYGSFSWQQQSLTLILPFWIAAAGLGAQRVANSFPMQRSAYRWLLAIPIAYELFTFPHFLARYSAFCDYAQSAVNFARAQHFKWSGHVSVGIFGTTDFGYFMPGRRIVRLDDMIRNVHPPLRHPVLVLESFKRHPDLRFDYWLIPLNKTNAPVVLPALGELVAADEASPSPSSRWAVFRANWHAFEGRSRPLIPETQSMLEGLRCIARLDVGSSDDESEYAYHILSRLPDTRLGPFVAMRKCGEPTILETGEVVLGADRFTLTVIPFRPLYIIMRTANFAEVSVAQHDGIYAHQTFHFRSPLILRPIVNGRALPDCPLQLSQALDAFAELVLEIPADYVDTDRLEITLVGDHIACAYWCFQ